MSPPSSPKSLPAGRTERCAEIYQSPADIQQRSASQIRTERLRRLHRLCNLREKIQPTVEDYRSSSSESVEGEMSTDTFELKETEQDRVPDPQMPRRNLPASHYGQTWNDIAVFNDQQALFQSLETLCTTAARTFWLSQSNCALDRSIHQYANQQAHHRYRYHPYPVTGNFQQPHQEAMGLAAYLVRISNVLWERAPRAEDHAQDLGAVYRMGNLYHWGNRIAMAAAADLGLMDGDTVSSIVLEAIEMAAYFLHDAVRRQILELWIERRTWIDPRAHGGNGGPL
ncbi:MAG: hypothetical protein MMC33_008506 [Icmadophila ericetorum]|nr:hypothetical protein [Icmadophila ericetorum]